MKNKSLLGIERRDCHYCFTEADVDEVLAKWTGRAYIYRVPKDIKHIGEEDELTRGLWLRGKRWLKGPSDLSEKPSMTDGASSQREPEAMRKRLAWIEKMAAKLYASSDMEIRNRLTPIMVGTRMLKDDFGTLSGREIDEVASMICESVTRFESWIRAVNDLARIAFGKPDPTLCQLNDAVNAVLERLERVVKSKTIAVQVTGLSDVPTIEADYHQLRMLLYHFIAEVISRIPEGSTITVRGETDPQQQSVLLSLAFPGIAAMDDVEWWDVAVHVMEMYGGIVTTELLAEGGTRVTLSFPIEALSPGCTEEAGKTKRLFAAVRVGDVVRTKKLIEQGASVNAHEESEAPLPIAARSGSVEVVQLLLEAGAEVNAKDARFGTTPLHVAVFFSELPAVAETLLRAGADVNAQDNQGQAPLHRAVERGHPAMVKLLLDKGASVTLTDRQGRTPLHVPVHDAAVVNLLVKAGAPVNATDANGKTALHCVGNLGCAEALLKAGADVNAQDNDGRTPLHRAVAICHSGLIKLMAEAGGNPNIADRQGKTPLQLAMHKGYMPDVDVLRKAGGK